MVYVICNNMNIYMIISSKIVSDMSSLLLPLPAPFPKIEMAHYFGLDIN